MTRKGWLLFIAMSVVWGIPYLFIKIAVRELDPAVVVFARVAIAAFRGRSIKQNRNPEASASGFFICGVRNG